MTLTEIVENLPPMYAVRRRLPSGEEVNIPARVQQEWERLNLAGQVKGKRIALGFGSRGVARIAEIAHEMVAMVAPRGLFIMDNPAIANLGPKSASVAALAGAEVYKALGAGDNITYYSDVQNGNHCSMRPEWSDPLKKAVQKFLTKTGSAPGVMKIASKANGNLADWKDWETPALN